MRNILFLLFTFFTLVATAQKGKKIKIINADVTFMDENNSEAMISVGNVYAEIDGATLRCKRLELYPKKNYMKAMGDVIINQGDTVIQTSKFTDYDGNKKLAKSWGNVVVKDPVMTLSTEEIYFDRAKQYMYYETPGVIKDSINILESNEGNYFLSNKKFQALNNVVITNPEHVVNSNHLDYYTNTGKAYLYGPSTITGETSVVYTEKGYTDTRSNLSHLTKNSWIQYSNRLIEGDSLFHNETQKFSSATGNIKVTDTINNSLLKGGYAEFYKNADSAFVVSRAVAISVIEQDSLYIHGDTLLITGKTQQRKVRAYHNVKIFKSDLQGKCDSLVSLESTGLTKMYRKPIIWSQGNQVTGDTIYFKSDKETEKMDSLMVLSNAFMIQKDSTGFNQTKGRDILGKFIENDLKIVDVVGNGDVLHHVRNSENELIGITKMRCSNIQIMLEESQIETISFFVKPDGKTYPVEEVHKNDRTLKGFVWREDEQPLTKEDIFINDPRDIDIVKLERIKEKEAREKAKKEAEEARLLELQDLELERKQDSILSINKEINSDNIKQ